MRYLFIGVLFVIASVNAQPVVGPWTLANWENDAGVRNLKVVGSGSDTVEVFWDTANYPDEYYVYHATVVLGQDSFLVPPHRVPSSVLGASLNDAILLDNGDWVVSINVNLSTRLYRGYRGEVLQSLLLIQGEYPEGICWGQCWDFHHSRLVKMPGSQLLVSGAIWRYFYIGSGATETDSEPHIFVVNVPQMNVDWELPVGPVLFGAVEPQSLPGDTIEMLLWDNLGGNSTIVQLYEGFNFELDTLLTTELTCSVSDYPDYEFVRLPSGRRLLAGNGWTLRELMPDGECLNLGSFTGPYYQLEIAYHEGFGFLRVSTDYTPELGVILSRLDTNGIELATPGHVHWPDNNLRARTASTIVTDNGLLGVFWVEAEAWPGELSQLRYTTVGWDTYLGGDESQPVGVPKSISLSAYPNPFNSEVTLEYEVPRAGKTELAVYNIEGREVARIVDEVVAAGSHSIHWSPQVASGVYFAKLTAVNTSATTKLLYLR